MTPTLVLLLSLGIQAPAAASPPPPQVPAQFITVAEAEAVLKEQIAKTPRSAR